MSTSAKILTSMDTALHWQRSLIICFCFLVSGFCAGSGIHAEDHATALPVERAAEKTLGSRALRPGNGLQPGNESSVPAGTWYLNAGGLRLTAIIEKLSETYRGRMLSEGGVQQQLDQIRWDPSTGSLEFRSNEKGGWRWYGGTVVEGVLVGRSTPPQESSDRPLRATSYTVHVTGWKSDYFDRDIVPRVYEVLLNHELRGRLRIDRASLGSPQFAGRLKVYSTVSAGAKGEEAEYDLDVQQWDGTHLKFTRHMPASTQVFTGVAKGRTISGSYTDLGTGKDFMWRGSRAEVLGYGTAAKSPADRTAWQERTRRQLYHLMMAGNPLPLSRKVVTLRENLAPWASPKLPANRDDDPTRWQQNYRLAELEFDYTLPNPYGGPPLTRRAHAYLSVPNSTSANPAKFPAVLAVNGHDGSAWKMVDPSDWLFWYGDSFARRGYIVLALDISHRPISDRARLYTDRAKGDDPAHGNGPHPAIRAPGFDSDWEEDGERVWDAMRALDYLLSLPEVDSKRVLVAGLSLGGEVATYVGALDPRVALTVAAGYSPDMGVMTYYGNHRCWCWLKGDIREYVDISDIEALIAPRPLVVETGRQDYSFSGLKSPFASDKQVARRTRAAYGAEADNFLHYLHYDAHRFHVGGLNPAGSGVPKADILLKTDRANPDVNPKEQSVRTPLLIEPDTPWSLQWQLDGRTSIAAPTLFDWINRHLAP